MARRDALRLTVASCIAAVASRPVFAGASPAPSKFVRAPDVVVFCDPALCHSVRRLGVMFRARTGVPVRLICAPGRLMAEQLTRNERDDILISLSPVVQRLASSGLADPQPSVGAWRNRLVVAGKGTDAGATPATPGRLPALLADRKFGAPDAGPNAIVDTAALIRRLGLEQALAGRIVGELDTGGVAWLLAHDQVGLGLVLATDARDRGFPTAVAIPDDAYPAVRYAAAFARYVLSRNAAAFMQFMATDQARSSLTQSGLEIEA